MNLFWKIVLWLVGLFVLLIVLMRLGIIPDKNREALLKAQGMNEGTQSVTTTETKSLWARFWEWLFGGSSKTTTTTTPAANMARPTQNTLLVSSGGGKPTQAGLTNTGSLAAQVQLAVQPRPLWEPKEIIPLRERLSPVEPF